MGKVSLSDGEWKIMNSLWESGIFGIHPFTSLTACYTKGIRLSTFLLKKGLPQSTLLQSFDLLLLFLFLSAGICQKPDLRIKSAVTKKVTDTVMEQAVQKALESSGNPQAAEKAKEIVGNMEESDKKEAEAIIGKYADSETISDCLEIMGAFLVTADLIPPVSLSVEKTPLTRPDKTIRHTTIRILRKMIFPMPFFFLLRPFFRLLIQFPFSTSLIRQQPYAGIGDLRVSCGQIYRRVCGGDERR